MAGMHLGTAFITAILASTAASATQTPVSFNLINIGGAGANTTAGKGFAAAAAYWSSVLTTSQPTTFNIEIGFHSLGEGILGSTRSSYTAAPIVNVSNRIAALQSSAQDSVTVRPTLRDGYFGQQDAVHVKTPGYTGCCDFNGDPYGIDTSTKVYDTDSSYNNSVIGLTTANAKALGYTFAPGNIDASIQFSSDFMFDFNPRDGIKANMSDFYAVAIHEIGHALGFTSGVDAYDELGTGGPAANEQCFVGVLCKDYPANDDWFGETLDLFRYSAPGVLDWTTNTASYFSLDGGVTAYQDGYFSTGTYTGDGWQASHWKAPQLPGGQFSCAMPKLGIMNPYICDGRPGVVTGLDLAALDAIGYNTSQNLLTYGKTTAQIAHDLTFVPEPATWVLMIGGFGMVGGALRRQRRTGFATA